MVMHKLASNLTGTIGMIGNLNIDLAIRNVSNLPDWGHEVFGDDHNAVSAGQATNSALALRKLGHSVKMIGNVGEDAHGQQILATLRENGMTLDGIEVTPGTQTAITIAIVRPDGERAFISDPACLRQFTSNLVERHLHMMDDCDVVCLLGIFFLPGISLPELSRITAELQSRGKTTLLDTGWDADNWQAGTLEALASMLGHIDIFIPNEEEAKAITGSADPQKAAQALSEAGPKIVVVKLGPQGSFLYSRDEQRLIPAHTVQVVDAIGAGDVFNAGFIHGYLQGWPLAACVQFGNSVSSIYISRTRDRFPGLKQSTTAANQYQDFEFVA